MIASGAFTEDDGLELIEEWAVRKMAKGRGHELATGSLEDFLRGRLPEGWHVRNQAPITLAPSEPEPDLSIDGSGYERCAVPCDGDELRLALGARDLGALAVASVLP